MQPVVEEHISLRPLTMFVVVTTVELAPNEEGSKSGPDKMSAMARNSGKIDKSAFVRTNM